MQLPVFPLLGIYSKERVGQVHQDVRVRPCHCYWSETGNTRMSSVRTGQLPALYLVLSINIKHAKVSPQLCSPKGSPVAFASQPNFLQRPLHFPPVPYHPVPRLPATATAVTKIIGTRPMLQNPADSKHGLSGAFNIVAHFLLSVAMALYSPGFCSFHPAASSWSPSLAPQPLPAPRRGPASGLCPGLPSHSPTASRRQPGFSSASSTPEELMFLTRAPSLAADWTHCLNVTCFSDSEYPNLHSPYPLSQWHHCLPKTNVNVGFSLPSI